MTDFHHDHVAVYAELGGTLRLARATRAQVTDAVTGSPVSVTQGTRTATYVDTDDHGRATFTATTPNRLRLTVGAAFIDVWPIEAAGPDDAAVAALLGYASATLSAGNAIWVQGVTGPGANGTESILSGDIHQEADADHEIELNLDQTSYGIGPVIHGRRAAGTPSAPLGVTSGTLLWGLGARPYDGSVFTEHSAAALNFWAEEDFDTSGHGASVAITVTPVGGTWGTRSEVVRFLRRAVDQGGRLVADLSNATRKLRLLFQSAEVNAGSNLGVIPNGTSRTSQVTAWNAADPDNAGYASLRATDTAADFVTGQTGTGVNVPARVVVGGSVVAAQWGTDGNLDRLMVPTVQAYKSTGDQTIATATHAAITFNAEAWDTDGMHSTSTNTSRVVAPVAGKYRVTATLAFAANATGARIVHLRVNGTSTDRYGYQGGPTIGASLLHPITTSAEIALAAGDYVEVFAYQSSGGDLAVPAETQAGTCRLSMTYVGV